MLLGEDEKLPPKPAARAPSGTVANTIGLGAQRQVQLSLRLNF
jgi:hypothetical protein